MFELQRHSNYRKLLEVQISEPPVPAVANRLANEAIKQNDIHLLPLVVPPPSPPVPAVANGLANEEVNKPDSQAVVHFPITSIKRRITYKYRPIDILSTIPEVQ